MPELRGVYFKNDKTQSLPLFPSESSEGRWVFELRDALMRGDALRAAAAFHNANKTDLLLGLVEAHSSVCFWDEMAFYLMFFDWTQKKEGEDKMQSSFDIAFSDTVHIDGVPLRQYEESEALPLWALEILQGGGCDKDCRHKKMFVWDEDAGMETNVCPISVSLEALADDDLASTNALFATVLDYPESCPCSEGEA